MTDRRKKSKKKSFRKSTMIMYWGVRLITIILLAYSIVGISLKRSDDSQVGDFTFIAINAFGLLLSSFVPTFIHKRWKIFVPDLFLRIYLGFVTAGLLLGEIGKFFVYVSWWDSILHLFSGSLIGVVGFSFIYIVNKTPDTELKLSPGLIAMFVFCFSLAVGVIWEIIEYTVDGIFIDSNMQRFRDSITGELWMGRKAIRDTMKDLILDTIGSFFISILGYIDLKRKMGLMTMLSLRRQKNPKKLSNELVANTENIQMDDCL